MLGHPAFIPMGQDPFAKALDATPAPGWFSAMPVAIDDAFTEGTGNSLFRIARDAFDMSPPMSAEEANAKYGHSGMQFYGPVQEETALRRYRAKLEERDRKAFLERADLGFASNLTAGLLSSLFDPAEMAINIGIALTATPAASGARIAGQAGMRASLMSGAARGAIEGAVGAAISEIPIGIASNLYQFDHTYADALFSIGGGAILGGFFGGLGGALSYRYRPRADQETHTAATQLAVSQAMSGQKPDVTLALGESPPLEVRFALREDDGGFDEFGNPRFARWSRYSGMPLGKTEEMLASRVRDIIRRIVPDAELQFSRVLNRQDVVGNGDGWVGEESMATSFLHHGKDAGEIFGGIHAKNPSQEDGGLRSIIAISLGSRDDLVLRTARHEAIHSLRSGGFFTDEEWAVLAGEARRPGGWLEKFKKPDSEKGLEEAIADAFGEWGLAIEPEAKTIFDKLDELIKRVRAALSGMGYTRWEQVFADIENGAIGARKNKSKINTSQSLRSGPYYQSAMARIGMTNIADAIRSGDSGHIYGSISGRDVTEKAARTIAEYDGMAGAANAPLEEVLGFLRAEYGADVEPKTLERRFAKILEDQRSAGMAEPPPADITARADEPSRTQEPEPETPPAKPEPEQEPKPEASAEPPAPPAEPPTAGLFDAIDDILRRIAPFAKREYLDRIDPRRFGRAQEAAQAHLGKPVTEEDLAGLEVDGVAYIRAGDVIVELAKRAIGGDPDAIARHEAIHALRLAGLFTDAEWNTLLHWARKDWARRYGKTTDDLGLEEAIADAFADWAKGNLVIQSEKPRTIMGRIRDFWTGVVDRLGGELSPRDIFDAVERGKIGRRGLGKEGSFGFEARKRAAMAAVGRTETYATEGVQDPDPAPPSRAAEGQDSADPSPAVEEINDITESLRADLDAGLISQQEFDEAMQAMQAATTRPAEMRKAMTEAVACELS